MPASPDSSWTIRSATAADLAAIVHLAVAFRDHLAQAAPSPDEFRDGFSRLLADRAAAITVAARANEDAAGYVLCRYRWSVWSGGEDVEVEDVFVAAAARRQGLGRHLVESALARAQARGCRYQVGTDMLFEMIPAYLEFFGLPSTSPEVLRAGARLQY